MHEPKIRLQQQRWTKIKTKRFRVPRARVNHKSFVSCFHNTLHMHTHTPISFCRRCFFGELLFISFVCAKFLFRIYVIRWYTILTMNIQSTNRWNGFCTRCISVLRNQVRKEVFFSFSLSNFSDTHNMWIIGYAYGEMASRQRNEL